MKNKKTGLFLLISQIVYALVLPYWFIVGVMSIMTFAQAENPNDWIPFIIIWLYPLFVLAAVIVSWILYHKRRFKAAGWWNLFPFLWPVAVVISALIIL